MLERPSILLLETIHPDAEALLAKAGEVVLAPRPEEPGDSLEHAAAIVTRGRGRITRETLEKAPHLRCIARCGVGTDNIDVPAATRRGIPVIYVPGATTTAVAEHTLMLMLACARRVTLFDRELRAGGWNIRDRAQSGIELAGKSLGVIGLGSIGRRVAELGEALGMEVVYWSRGSRDPRFQFRELPDLLALCDVITLHLELNDETRGLIGAEELASMKWSAILVNTARGGLVDQQALVRALKDGRLAGAGLDVLTSEPPERDDPLFQIENLVTTPHVAAITDATYRRICVDAADQVVRVLRGGEPDPRLVRNPKVLSR